MFRELRGEFESYVIKAGEDMVRGMVVTEDYANGQLMKADNVTEDLYIVNKDYQPTGAYSDVEVSDYTKEANAIANGTPALEVIPQLGAEFLTDQVVPTGLTANTSYVKAGTGEDEGKFVVAVATNISVYRYLGTDTDAGQTMYKFKRVEPHTVA